MRAPRIRKFVLLLSPLLSMKKSKIGGIVSTFEGTSPGIFSLRAERLSRTPKTFGQIRILPASRCSIPFPVLASASSGDRTGDYSLETVGPPAPRGPRCSGHVLLPQFQLARFWSAPESFRTVLAFGGFYEELSHQGHPKRWHCRPRRHRQDATGVVVALHRGHHSALGKNCGRQHYHRLGRRRNRQKNLHSNGPRPCRVARPPRHSPRIFRQS